MNALARLFVNTLENGLAARLLICTAACALTSACVGNPFSDAKVDPSSPIAAEVARTGRGNPDFPSFRDIPPVPKDVRAPQAYGRAAAAMDSQRAELERATAPGTWTLKATDTFAVDALKAAGPDLPPADPTASEAFAKDLRKRATPPPPPKR
jgi:hypothetical protein